jgi:hypothetical protein
VGIAHSGTPIFSVGAASAVNETTPAIKSRTENMMMDEKNSEEIELLENRIASPLKMLTQKLRKIYR